MNTEHRIRRLRQLKWSVLVLLTLLLTAVEAYYYCTQEIPLAKGVVDLTIGVLGAAAVHWANSVPSAARRSMVGV